MPALTIDDIAKLKATMQTSIYQAVASFEKATGQQVDSLCPIRNASGNCTDVKIRVIVQLL